MSAEATSPSKRHRRPPKPLIALVVLALLAGAGYWFWSRQNTPEDSTLRGSGAVEATTYQVAAATAGTLVDVAVAEGDTVKKGDIIAKLDPAALTLQVTQANEGVTAAAAALQQAKNDDLSDAEITAAQAKVKQAQAMVSLAKVQLGYATVTAPHAGTVTLVTANAGENASPGRNLATISDAKDVFVTVYIPETKLGEVSVGQTVKAVADGSSTRHPGKVTWVSSQAEFTPNNVETADQRAKLVFAVKVSLANATTTLKAGLPVTVTF